MNVCESCQAEAKRSFEQHGDERFPPSTCFQCGGWTQSAVCISMMICDECAQAEQACPACGTRADGSNVISGPVSPAP